MSYVDLIIERVGTKRLCECLGVGLTTISNAKRAQAFPARWFLVVRELAVKLGVDIEGREFLDSFTFIETEEANSQVVGDLVIPHQEVKT
jgi:hypothetical protein